MCYEEIIDLEQEFECPVCGGQTPKEGYPCSGTCFEAGMM